MASRLLWHFWPSNYYHIHRPKRSPPLTSTTSACTHTHTHHTQASCKPASFSTVFALTVSYPRQPFTTKIFSQVLLLLGTFKQGVSKQRVTTFAWRLGSQYDVAVTRGASSVLTSDCRAQFGRPSTRRGCHICVTVRLLVRPHRETMYWQANGNTPFPLRPFKCARFW